MQCLHGGDFFIALSSLQKEIRRAKVDEALWWAFELAESGYVPAVATRLRVIGFEDIGVGDPVAVLFALQNIDHLERWYPSKGSWRLCLTNAVVALARASSKSRDGDLGQAMTRWRRATQPPPHVPPYALDKHTMAGKKAGKGVEDFVNEGTRLFPNDVSTQAWKDVALEAFTFLDGEKRAAKEKAEEDAILEKVKQRRLGAST